MKKLQLFAFAFAAATTTGCSFPGYDVLYYTDFTRYADNGFTVSSVSDFTGHPYVALGDISLVSMLGATDGRSERLTAQDILDKVVTAAQKKGANGVIGYRSDFFPGNNKERSYWSASGVAVRFEGNAVINTPPTNHTIPQTVEKTVQKPAPQVYVPAVKTEDVVKTTVEYAIAQKIPVRKPVGNDWDGSGEMKILDINTKEYISKGEFVGKYGQQIYAELMQAYRSAKKSLKK